MYRFSHIAILVHDLSIMESFYIKAFNMRVTWCKENEKSYLTTGNGDILGLQVSENFTPLSEISLQKINSEKTCTPNFIHFGTITECKQEYNNLRKKLSNLKIRLTDNKISRDESESFYLHDPEKNLIQISYIPREYFK